MGTVVEFPVKIAEHRLADPVLLQNAAKAASEAATLLGRSNPSADDLEQSLQLLNDAWGVAAAFLIFQLDV